MSAGVAEHTAEEWPVVQLRDRDARLVYLGGIECVECARCLPNLLVRLTSGVCVGCEKSKRGAR